MCQMWGVNRCTLRSAIAALTEQGIVYAVQGSGTRIAHRFRRILQDLQGFSEYAADCGLRPETRLLSMSQVECDKQLSRRLHLVLGENAYRISRLRILNGQPTLIETAYIPAALAPGLEQHHDSRRGGGRSSRHRRRGSCVLDRQHHANAGGRSCGILPHRGKSGQGGAGQHSPPRRKRGIRSCVKSAINPRFIFSCAR